MEVQRKIAVVVSMNRICFTEPMWRLVQLARALPCSMYRHTGAFWEQSLSRLLEDASLAGHDYIITLDYDSGFEVCDVLELIRLMEVSGADAIFPFQMKRECDQALLAVHEDELKDGGKPDFSKELIRANTGHFGLTAIRCSSLMKMEHPWLWSVPNQDTGMWRDGKTDADIYFWQMAKECGWKVYQANRVCVGHGQMMFTWPGKDGKVIFQYCEDFEKNGKPKDLWCGGIATEGRSATRMV